jgi:hypothetical protein
MRQLIEVGASGFRSMAWSHFLGPGNLSESTSEKMLPNLWYCFGTSSSQLCSSLLSAYLASCWAMVVFFSVRVIRRIQDEGLLMGGRTSVVVIVPHILPVGQSISGLATSKKGYPRMMSSSPMSATKNLCSLS